MAGILKITEHTGLYLQIPDSVVPWTQREVQRQKGLQPTPTGEMLDIQADFPALSTMTEVATSSPIPYKTQTALRQRSFLPFAQLNATQLTVQSCVLVQDCKMQLLHLQTPNSTGSLCLGFPSTKLLGHEGLIRGYLQLPAFRFTACLRAALKNSRSWIKWMLKNRKGKKWWRRRRGGNCWWLLLKGGNNSSEARTGLTE